ncbi:hypothetical protein FF011L_51730 [Roseimaritima multifibrata]|uniref:Uncharacterized protein n=1 Tax=Roseimaritima multifibrata TaxID=1930274 RepID=A0A517MNA6_9BACT|nr:hypothetical protein FF011L_51730 [Roseimaritima multifibrata]
MGPISLGERQSVAWKQHVVDSLRDSCLLHSPPRRGGATSRGAAACVRRSCIAVAL